MEIKIQNEMVDLIGIERQFLLNVLQSMAIQFDGAMQLSKVDKKSGIEMVKAGLEKIGNFSLNSLNEQELSDWYDKEMGLAFSVVKFIDMCEEAGLKIQKL